jgi:hypothetical protein
VAALEVERMGYKPYKTAVTCLCPVAVKLGQDEVHAPEHSDWGVVTCDTCREKFRIGPNRIYGSRLTDVQCAAKLEAILADDHKSDRAHANHYQIPD